MNTRMIEVALGLALVFAMTSLLLTAVRELWASAWNSRGKTLMQALVSFVGDDPEFARRLMQHPLLLSLSRETAGGDPKPSYMGADIVVTSLVASLVEHCPGGARPVTPAAFLQALAALPTAVALPAATRAGGVPRPNATLLRGMVGLVHGVENDWAGFEARLCAWYDSVTERATGWFKRRNQVSLLLFGFVVAALANINPILIANRLWQDAPLREAIANAAAQAAKPDAGAAASGADGDCTAIGDAQVKTFCGRLQDLGKLHEVGIPMGWNPPGVPDVLGADCKPNTDCGWRHYANLALVLVGWLVTAMAVSLGAPFWFDALGKLANLRAAGPPPSAADRSGIASTPPGGTTMSQPSTADIAPTPVDP